MILSLKLILITVQLSLYSQDIHEYKKNLFGAHVCVNQTSLELFYISTLTYSSKIFQLQTKFLVTREG